MHNTYAQHLWFHTSWYKIYSRTQGISFPANIHFTFKTITEVCILGINMTVMPSVWSNPIGYSFPEGRLWYT